MRPSLKDREFLALLRQVQAEEADKIRKATPTRGVNDGKTTKSTPKALSSQWTVWDFDGSIVVGRLDTDDGRTIYVGKRQVARNGRVFVHDLAIREVADLWKATPDTPGPVLLKRSLLVEGWTINRADSLIDRRDRPADGAAPPSRSMYDRAIVPEGATASGRHTGSAPAPEEEHPSVTPATLPPPGRRMRAAPNPALASAAAAVAAEREAAKVAAAHAASEQAAAEQAAAEQAAARAAEEKAAADRAAAEAAAAQLAAEEKAAAARAAQEQAAAAEMAAAEHAAAEQAAVARAAAEQAAAEAAAAERAAAERATAERVAAEQAARVRAAAEQEATERAAAATAAAAAAEREQAAAEQAERERVAAEQEAALEAAKEEAARRAALAAAPPPDLPPPTLPSAPAAVSADDLAARARDALSLLQAVDLVEGVAHDAAHAGSLGVFSLGLRHEVSALLEPLVAAGFVSGPPAEPFAGARSPAGEVPLAEVQWQLRRYLDGSNPGGGWVLVHRPPS